MIPPNAPNAPNAPNDRPVEVRGTVQARDVGRTCAFCMGRTFRRSRLQLKDVTSLLGLHYPVRCLSCSKRQTVSLEVARRAVPSTVRQVKARGNAAGWDGSPWSDPGTQARPEPGVLAMPKREAAAMPDLQGVRLPHVARMPPGDGENLA